MDGQETKNEGYSQSEEKSLAIAFHDSLKENAFSCCCDLAEVGIDAIMNDGILKEVPLLSTVIGFYKIGSGIKERHTIKKLSVFLGEIGKGIVDEQKLLEYQRKFQDDEKKRTKEIERLLVLIDRYTDYDKPKSLAKLYMAYLRERLSWDELVKYAEVLDRFLPNDFEQLSKGNQHGIHCSEASDSLLRLVSLGLMVEHSIGSNVVDSTLIMADPEIKDYDVSIFGNKLVEILNT